MEAKIDYKKEYKNSYNPSPRMPVIVEVPNFKYLMVDGIGMDFSKEDSQNAIQALFGVAYKVKFTIKKGQGMIMG
jgi:hypothetical protein